MGKKVSANWNTSLILSIVFGFMGAVYLFIGLVLMNGMPREEGAVIVGWVFMPLGVVFLCLSAVFTLLRIRKKREQARLLEEGRYVWGQITEVEFNYSVRVNRRHPQVAIVQYRDTGGTVHIFKSGNVFSYGAASLVGQQVRVFTQPPKYDPYYVEIEPLLAMYQEH